MARLAWTRPAYSPADLAALARFHWWPGIIVACGVLLLAAALLWPGRVGFVADRLLVVAPSAMAERELAIPDVSSDTAVTEISLLRSPAVTMRVVREIGPAVLFPSAHAPHLFGLLPPPDAAQRASDAAALLAERLIVAPVPGSPLVRIGFAHADRDVALRTVAAVTTAYLDLQRARRAADGAPTSQALDVTIGRLNALNQRMRQTQLDHQVFDIARDRQAALAALDAVIAQDAALRERRAVVSAGIETVRGQLASQPDRVFDAEEAATQSPEAARDLLTTLKLEREHMAAQYSPSFPGVQELDRKIATAEKLAQQPAKLRSTTTRYVRNPALEALRTRRDALEVERAGIDQQLQDLAGRMKTAVARISAVRTAERDLSALATEKAAVVAAERTMLRGEAEGGVLDAVQQADAVDSHALGLATVTAEAASRWPLFLLAGGVAVLVVAVAAFIGAIVRRRVYVVPHEMERDLGLPALARFDARDPALLSPVSRDRIDELAAVLVAARQRGQALIAFDLLPADEGAPALAIIGMVARHLGDAYGMRARVMEPHAFDALSLAAPDEGEMGQYDLPLPAAQPLRSYWLQMIERLRARYDIVLVPTIGAEGAGVSTLADAHLLVLQAAYTPVALARQMRDRLAARSAAVLGVVFIGQPRGAL